MLTLTSPGPAAPRVACTTSPTRPTAEASRTMLPPRSTSTGRQPTAFPAGTQRRSLDFDLSRGLILVAMKNTPIRLAVIVGSTRAGRFAPVVANWFTDRARRREDLDVEVIDLAEQRLPADLTGMPTPEVTEVTERLDAADAFVVVTPEYNHRSEE